LKKDLPVWLGAGAGALVVITRWFGWAAAGGVDRLADRAVVASYAAAAAIGFIGLTRVHLRAVAARRPLWGYSLLLLLAMYGYAGLLLVEPPSAPLPDWIFQNVLGAIFSTMYGLIAFFITSAAWRAFRVRSWETAALLGAAVVALLGNAALGERIVPGWDALLGWLMAVPVTGGFRAIQIGAALGALGTAMRVLTGLERSHLGRPSGSA
jgi:hypothetical protein